MLVVVTVVAAWAAVTNPTDPTRIAAAATPARMTQVRFIRGPPCSMSRHGRAVTRYTLPTGFWLSDFWER